MDVQYFCLIVFCLVNILNTLVDQVNCQAAPPPPPPVGAGPIRPAIAPVGGNPHLGERRTIRCYICAWTVAQCTDFNCYNNPDVCTNNNFSPSLVQQADCPGGCEQFVVTDPNGLVQQWRRNCAPGNIPTTGFNCRTEYQLGIRIDRCFCNKDWCNGSVFAQPQSFVTLGCLLLLFLYHRLFQ